MNRKLRKLLRDPKKFFLDLKLFGSNASAMFTSKQAVPTSPDPFQEREDEPVATEATGTAELLAAVASAPATNLIAAPRQVVDPEPIVGIEGYEHFALHGHNWLDGTARPVAVLWGFEGWQRGFVAQYLTENRAAFVDASTLLPELEANLDRLEGFRFIVWGHSEDEAVRMYAKRRGVAIARMADGFIRSASRGKDETIPYSMVLDETGLYSNAAEPSDLEHLLGTHDFSLSKSLLDAVPALIRLHRQLGIGKYNLGSLRSASRLLGPKLRRRILVIGERAPAVRPEASSNEWTPRQLVELAVSENPGAEIIFRPHPDSANKYRKTSSKTAELTPLCRVLSDDVTLADLLHSCDRVYVVESLAGMEALIHGIPVTVVGSPYYAGWGLTDDRQDIPRRARHLGLDELYCAAYLLYPRYLADLQDPVTGCLATILRVAAERRQKLDSAVTPDAITRHAASMARTDYWPVLLSPANREQFAAKYGEKVLSVFSIEHVFAESTAEHFQRSIAYLIAGQFQQVPTASLLNRMQSSMRTDVFRQVLLDLWRMNPSGEVLQQLAWCCEQAGEFDEARALLEHLAFGGELKKDPDSRLPMAPSTHPVVIRLAQLELDQKQIARAEQLFNWLLLSGCLQPEVLVGLSAVARLRFDFRSAALLLGVARRLHPTWRRGRAHSLHAQACELNDNAAGALESMAVACLASPMLVGAVPAIHRVLIRQIGALPYDQAMLMAVEMGESDNIIGRAMGLIAHERHADAERLLLSHRPRPANLSRHALTLSAAYSYQGKLADAIAVVGRLLETFPTLPVYHEALRLAVRADDYAWGQALLIAAEERHLEVKEAFKQKIALGLGQVKECYLGYRKGKSAAALRSYLGSRYVQSLQSLARHPGATNLVVAASGPGDEIRFTTFYEEIHAAGGNSRVVFTCDPRLLGLLRRHYTQFEFVPTARIRHLSRLENFQDHQQLPGSDLHSLFDNRGWGAAKSADKVILVHDALGDVIDDHASFKGVPCLKADPELVRQWRSRVPERHRGELLVGLSWRSSLTSLKRNENYLAVEDLLPLFQLDGLRFINLQYDDCREELAWLEERFPGRLLHFEDLDQFNDLDGVAALMECLDLVIAPCTTVVELAGALGRPTFLLSLSSELHWRRIAGTHVDVWQNSILHVEGPVLGDKSGLVRALASELQQRVSTTTSVVRPVFRSTMPLKIESEDLH